MRSYKILILFILLSVVCFGNNGIGVGIVSIGISSTDPITFELVIETKTGDKFKSPVGSITNILIENGNSNIDSPEDVNLIYIKEVVQSPKVVTTFNVSIPTKIKDFSSYPFITISCEININDPDGNVNAVKKKKISFGPVPTKPNGNIDLTVYEKIMTNGDWMNTTTGISGVEIEVDDYIFTKGGPKSLEDNPGIYVVGSTGEGLGQIAKLKIQKNNETEETITVPFVEKTDFSMKISDFINNKKNTIIVKPISVLGAEGPPKNLNFVLDTQINNSYLEGGIIGELESEGNVDIDLSSLLELSGIKGYSYTFIVENKSISDNESNLDGQSSTVLTGNSITSTPKWKDGIVVIPTSGFIPGSKATLAFTVYDKLGHKKTFKKTYFIPAESNKITSTVQGEAKQRKSKLKIIGEGSNDKFRLERSIDASSE